MELYKAAEMLNKYMKCGYFTWNGVKSTNERFIIRLSKLTKRTYRKEGSFYCVY